MVNYPAIKWLMRTGDTWTPMANGTTSVCYDRGTYATTGSGYGKCYLPWSTSATTTGTCDINYDDWQRVGTDCTIIDSMGNEYSGYMHTVEQDADGRWTVKMQYHPLPKATPADRLKAIMAARIAPAIHLRRQPIVSLGDVREQRARETLRRVIGEDRFRRFLASGFVSVRAKSGMVYQIHPGHGLTKVYRDGKMIEQLCVVLSGNFPPTDSIIMRYLLILNDEVFFRSKANVSGPTQTTVRTRQDLPQQNLAELFRSYQQQA